MAVGLSAAGSNTVADAARPYAERRKPTETLDTPYIIKSGEYRSAALCLALFSNADTLRHSLTN